MAFNDIDYDNLEARITLPSDLFKHLGIDGIKIDSNGWPQPKKDRLFRIEKCED